MFKPAHTIADLVGGDEIQSPHLAEALQYPAEIDDMCNTMVNNTQPTPTTQRYFFLS